MVFFFFFWYVVVFGLGNFVLCCVKFLELGGLIVFGDFVVLFFFNFGFVYLLGDGEVRFFLDLD